MNEDVYVLKRKLNDGLLSILNDSLRLANCEQIKQLIDNYDNGFPDTDEMRDWIDALESGKKIVNPVSPRQHIRAIRNKYCQQICSDREEISITKHEFGLLLLYAEKAVREGEADG